MLYLIALLLGLVIGFACGGRVGRIAHLRLRWLWLVPVALVIQLLVFPLFATGPLLPYATAPLHLVSYVLLMVWLALNLRVLPVGVLFVGATANLVAIASNGGYMPASVTALEGAGLGSLAEQMIDGQAVANVILMSPSTRVNPLGDWLYLPEWFPFSTAFSVGDVLIMAGLAWLIARGMVTDA